MVEPVARLDERAPRFALGSAGESCEPMSEGEFRILYERTSRSLLLYLDRLTGNRALAEDLMQESYLRLLRAGVPSLDPPHLKNYLFKTATNLARDHFRSKAAQAEPIEAGGQLPVRPAPAGTAVDVHKILGQVTERERSLLWLAYVEGSSHREIAAVTGLKEESIRPMLFRARQRVAQLLRGVQ